MSRFFTPTLAALEPYTPGEQLARPDLVKLNANENPYPPAPRVAAAVADTVAGLRLYSDLRQTKLVSAIAARCGVPEDWVLCGNGSDENLLLAIRAFCDESTPLAFAISPTASTPFCATCSACRPGCCRCGRISQSTFPPTIALAARS